jgi:nitroreductase
MTTPPAAPEPFVPPEAPEALAGLTMPLAEAMRTQRAIRRLHLDPVDTDVLREVLALALKAPTSSNSQDWAFVVVNDPAQKRRLVRSYQRAFKLFGWFARRTAPDEPTRRQLRVSEWQREHYHELPTLVVACYRRTLKHRPVGWPQLRVSSFYGSVYPAVQNLLLACRAVGLGASLQTLPLWQVRNTRNVLQLPPEMVPVCIIPIGWARGRYGPTQRPPIDDVVHVDRFGNQPWRSGQADKIGRGSP